MHSSFTFLCICIYVYFLIFVDLCQAPNFKKGMCLIMWHVKVIEAKDGSYECHVFE